MRQAPVVRVDVADGLQRFTKIGQVALNADTDDESDPENPLLTSTYTFTIYVYTGNDPGEQP